MVEKLLGVTKGMMGLNMAVHRISLFYAVVQYQVYLSDTVWK
jgi:hypothetical protein